MGRIVFPRGKLTGTLSEIVGYKSGLALDEQQLSGHVDDGYHALLLGEPEEVITIRSEEAEEIVSQLLYGVGTTPVRHRLHATSEILRRVRDHPNGMQLYADFQQLLLAVFRKAELAEGPFDVTELLEKASEKLGPDGFYIALMWCELTQISFEQSPWSQVRRVEWSEVAQLNDLFHSESLAPPDNGYLDQRFVDYLARNENQLDIMNWRKFEALVCEFFDRMGCHVEIGEGRNDGGIDARVWANEEARGSPPALLVQCKRQKSKIEKVVVKALWADVVNEGAKSGLVVTTSTLSPGAEKVCAARSYPVHQADRKVIKTWLEAMRTPQTGVFLGL